jgi:hypothetical protein
LQPVIHDNGKLIRPVAMAITDEEVAALFGRTLLLRAQTKVREMLCRWVESHAETQPKPFSQLFVRTSPRISVGTDTRPRALAGINETLLAQPLQRALVNVASVALSYERLVCRESQPLEIFQERSFELGPAARSIVILNPQQDPPTACARLTPDMDRIDDMPEVEIPGRRRGESRDDTAPGAVNTQKTYFNPNWI